MYALFYAEEEKYAAYTKRERNTKYGREQGEKVEELDALFNDLTLGMGRIYEALEERWGIEME